MGEGITRGEGRRKQERRQHEPDDDQCALRTTARDVADGHAKHDSIAHSHDGHECNAGEEYEQQGHRHLGYRDAE